MPKTKKRGDSTQKLCDFSRVFLFHFGHLQISMAWNHLIQRNHLQARVPKGSQEVSPHASTGGVRKGGGSLAVAVSPRWWVNWVTGYQSSKLSGKKNHVKIGASPSKDGEGGKSKIENSKIWTFSSCKILVWSRSKFKEITDSWCMILDGRFWISIGMCRTLILNNDIKSFIAHINWLRACKPKLHVQHLNKELLNRTPFPTSKKENITMERANISPCFLVAKKWPSQTRKDARIKDTTKHAGWIFKYLEKGSFKI